MMFMDRAQAYPGTKARISKLFPLMGAFEDTLLIESNRDLNGMDF